MENMQSTTDSTLGRINHQPLAKSLPTNITTLNSFFLLLIDTCCLILLIVSLVGFFGRFHWVVDLLNHTRPYLLAGGVLAVVLALVFNQQIGLYAALASCLINGVIVGPYLIPSMPSGPAASDGYTLMSANVMYGNRSPQNFLNTIRDVDPDILVLQEMSASNQHKAEQLWDQFPYASAQPNGGSLEVLVFSKLPFDSVKYIVGDKPWRSEAEIQMTIDSRPITLLAIHPKAPVSAKRFARRNQELDQIAQRVSTVESPLIVAGDMNITPWTPIFRTFLRQAGLSDGRRGFGLNFTWAPDNLPKLIPIDQVLYRGVNIHSFTSGANTGSDHLPVIVEFSIP